uniref:RAD50-interacting protein 1 n=1 Tax=Oryza rufipogon TaxID=4529 RepID=A0A0E0QCY6_ORYRU
MASPRPPPASLRSFLDAHFASPEDLASAPALAELLRRECVGLDASLRRLEAQLASVSASWLARSAGARASLRRIRSRGGGFGVEEDDGEETLRSAELPALVQEIHRIDAIRLYAAFVGNLEDATFSIVRQASKLNLSSEMQWKQEKLLQAVDAMRDIELELLRISTNRPQWTNLIMAVDSRVDKTLAILRPKALTDYRALLAALGWPPSLSSPDAANNKYSEIPNPLILMNEANKEKYSQSFLALCALQHAQANREARQCQAKGASASMSDSKYFDKTAACFDNGLWAIDELVQPIASRLEYHFAKWSEQPEFIFALVYKIARDFMGGVDDILQPLIDRARLVGLSAKESWVTGMVKMLLGYLERQIFPVLVTSYQATDDKFEVHSSWMHLNDLMITFDKRMQLLADSGIQKIASISEGLSRSLSVFSIYSEHSDWLHMWAGVELNSAQHKLKSEMEDEINWSYSIKELGLQEITSNFLLSTREDYKAPTISEFVVKTASAMIERGHALPNRGLRIQYNRSSSVQFLSDFFLVLRERCEALQLTNTALEDDSLLKASFAINAARYCEYVLREWDDDIVFLEMGAHRKHVDEGQGQGHKHSAQHPCSFFGDEIAFLAKLGTDYLEQIMSSVLLEFEDLSWDYVQNIGLPNEQIHPVDEVLDEENLGVSPGFVASLEVVRDRTTKLMLHLNSKDFLDLWRSIAEGLDYFIYSSIRWGELTFSDQGVVQLRVDTKALLHIFRPFCLRPEAFFPFISDSLRLLAMRKTDARYLLEVLKNAKENDSCLRQQGLQHVNASQAMKILGSKRSDG